ncbi:MAG: hypothetical protein LZ172_05470 [Thaumarchaeota archaeon]|jgi:phosphate/sulfate permease|nr:hypothetical protein [Candidatus Geocrenenecus arthurdayi]MCL7403776.1 hypothetical protein [Candidatus Geocrenenecus arthurdayi]
MLAGLMLEGWKMNPYKLITFDSLIIPVVAILVTLSICSVLAIPVSISNISVASLIGASLSLNTQINQSFLSITFLAWLLTPLIAVYLTQAIYLVLVKLFSMIRINSLYLFTRLTIYLATFYGAYTISANNLGFMLLMLAENSISMYPIVFLGVFMGAFFFSEKISYIIGERLAILSPVKLSSSLLSSSILLWILTQISIPAALTQIMLGGLIGAAFSSPISIINVRLLGKLLGSWIASFLLGILFSYMLGVMLK